MKFYQQNFNCKNDSGYIVPQGYGHGLPTVLIITAISFFKLIAPLLSTAGQQWSWEKRGQKRFEGMYKIERLLWITKRYDERNKMSENFHYYGKYKHKDNLVIRNDVVRNKTLQVRLDGELYSEIENLAKELNQTISKVTKDILEDFFLDQKLKRQQFEILDIN